MRVITVALLVTACVQALPAAQADPATVAAVAFVLGVFPSVALQLLRRTVGRLTGWARGGLEPPFPLRQLDGMDVWTEARLLEVGIEDVQHICGTRDRRRALVGELRPAGTSLNPPPGSADA